MFFSAETDPIPCCIFDANGDEMIDVLACNTDTGEVERLLHVDGELVVDPVSRRLITIRELRPAPLRIEYPPLRTDRPLPLTCDGFDL